MSVNNHVKIYHTTFQSELKKICNFLSKICITNNVSIL